MDIKISEVANLPSRFGSFRVQSFKQGNKEHLAIFKQPFADIVNVRIHSECLTGDAIGSLKCDCRDQLEASLKYIEERGGRAHLRDRGFHTRSFWNFAHKSTYEQPAKATRSKGGSSRARADNHHA